MQCIAERYYSVLLPPGRLLLSAQILLRIAERGRSVGLLLGKTFNYSISQTQSHILTFPFLLSYFFYVSALFSISTFSITSSRQCASMYILQGGRWNFL